MINVLIIPKIKSSTTHFVSVWEEFGKYLVWIDVGIKNPSVVIGPELYRSKEDDLPLGVC